MLLAYKINNTPLNKISNWGYSQLGGNLPFIDSPTLIDNYEDISSIINWDVYGIRLRDFNYIRDNISEITNDIG